MNTDKKNLDNFFLANKFHMSQEYILGQFKKKKLFYGSIYFLSVRKIIKGNPYQIKPNQAKMKDNMIRQYDKNLMGILNLSNLPSDIDL